jgi:hypothetical protein
MLDCRRSSSPAAMPPTTAQAIELHCLSAKRIRMQSTSDDPDLRQVIAHARLYVETQRSLLQRAASPKPRAPTSPPPPPPPRRRASKTYEAAAVAYQQEHSDSASSSDEEDEVLLRHDATSCTTAEAVEVTDIDEEATTSYWKGSESVPARQRSASTVSVEEVLPF